MAARSSGGPAAARAATCQHCHRRPPRSRGGHPWPSSLAPPASDCCYLATSVGQIAPGTAERSRLPRSPAPARRARPPASSRCAVGLRSAGPGMSPLCSNGSATSCRPANNTGTQPRASLRRLRRAWPGCPTNAATTRTARSRQRTPVLISARPRRRPEAGTRTSSRWRRPAAARRTTPRSNDTMECCRFHYAHRG